MYIFVDYIPLIFFSKLDIQLLTNLLCSKLTLSITVQFSKNNFKLIFILMCYILTLSVLAVNFRRIS